jgi:hypothetical protein
LTAAATLGIARKQRPACGVGAQWSQAGRCIWPGDEGQRTGTLKGVGGPLKPHGCASRGRLNQDPMWNVLVGGRLARVIVAASVLAKTCLPHANGRNNVPNELEIDLCHQLPLRSGRCQANVETVYAQAAARGSANQRALIE